MNMAAAALKRKKTCGDSGMLFLLDCIFRTRSFKLISLKFSLVFFTFYLVFRHNFSV